MGLLSKRPEAMLFDLDGTLADTLEQLALATCKADEEVGIAPPDLATVQSYVGNGVNMLLSRTVLGRFDISLDEIDPALLQKLRTAFNLHYSKGLHEHFRLYDGVYEGLAKFKAWGIKLAVVTNKPQVFADPLLEHMKLAPFFDYILGGEVLPQRKPDPAPLLKACEVLHVAPDKCLMMGDSDNDVLGAHRAGIKAVYFNYGFYKKDISPLKPEYRFDTFFELVNLIEGLPARI